jgi:mannosyl-oligosaccharide glucosidase
VAVEGPYQERAKKIYTELRTNIIDNVFKEYERTGYVWEQYNAQTGEGRRSHPFTGWTSLVTLSEYKMLSRLHSTNIPAVISENY